MGPDGEIKRILDIYENCELLETLTCVSNCEWDEEIQHYHMDIASPRTMPGSIRHIYKVDTGLAVIDLRTETEYSWICESYLPLPKYLTMKGGKKGGKKDIKIDGSNIFCSCNRSYVIKDVEIGVNCVPYFKPDGKLSVCAQSAMKTMITCIARDYGSPNISMPEIQKRISGGDPYGSSGLYSSDVVKGFSGLCGQTLYYRGLGHPEPYTDKDILSRMFSYTLHAYIESEIPVYMVFDPKKLWWWEGNGDNLHAIVGIGHTLDSKGKLDYFLVHDESHTPYRLLPREIVDNHLIESVVVLPPKVNVRYENAFLSMINSAFSYNELLRKTLQHDLSIDILKLFKKQRLRFRTMLASSTKVKEWYTDSMGVYGVRSTTRDVYDEAELPPFVWLFELKDKKRKDNTNFAQILINAVEGAPKISLVNLPDGAIRFKGGVSEDFTERDDPIPGDPGLQRGEIKKKWDRQLC